MSATAARGPSCPSELDLHRVVAGKGEATILAKHRAHLETCDRCRLRVEGLARVEVPAPTPAFLAALEVPEARRRPRRLPMVLAFAGTLGAVAVAWRLLPGGETPEVRTKGPVALEIVVRRASGTIERLGGGGTVAPGETFRFELAHAAGGYPFVVGLDARPSATLYAPASGDHTSLQGSAKTLLPEAIVADATRGAERIVALLCATDLARAEVEAAAGRALADAGGRPADVKSLGLPCAQASVLIEKVAPAP